MPAPKLPWSQRAPAREIECQPGWYKIVERLDNDMKQIFPGYRVVQVKEKLGSLHFYVENLPPQIMQQVHQRLVAAMEESRQTCEWCGAAGQWRNGFPGRSVGWASTTLCDACFSSYQSGGRPWVGAE